MSDVDLTDFVDDLQAAEDATAEDARVRLKVIKHYLRACLGDENINQEVKCFLEAIGIDVGDPWSVVIGYPFVLAVLKEVHNCKGSKCVEELKKKTARKMEKMKKEKALEKKRNAEKADSQAKQERGKCTKEVQDRKNSSKDESSSSEDESSVKFFKTPIHYI